MEAFIQDPTTFLTDGDFTEATYKESFGLTGVRSNQLRIEGAMGLGIYEDNLRAKRTSMAVLQPKKFMKAFDTAKSAFDVKMLDLFELVVNDHLMTGRPLMQAKQMASDDVKPVYDSLLANLATRFPDAIHSEFLKDTKQVIAQ